MNIWKYYIKPLITFKNPNTPYGRKLRIERLKEKFNVSDNIAKCIIYGRDVKYYNYFSDEETEDFIRVVKLLMEDKIVLPDNRLFLKQVLIDKYQEILEWENK